MEPKKESDVIAPNPIELNKFKKWARELPDVQQDKVDEIKRKIESGEYRVDAEAIVDKMLELVQYIRRTNFPSRNKRRVTNN